jgi:uncharacterized HAD superfamily protein
MTASLLDPVDAGGDSPSHSLDTVLTLGGDATPRLSGVPANIGAFESVVTFIIDIDSTLYDADLAWCEIFRDRFDFDMTAEDVETWDKSNDCRIALVGPEMFETLVDEDLHSERAIGGREPYAGAQEALASWHGAGHRIVIVSRRSPRSKLATEIWLRSHRIPFDELRTDPPKIDLVALAKSNAPAVLIDDRATTLIAASAAGIAVATIEHPYNRFAIGPDVVSATDWPSLATAVNRRFLGDEGCLGELLESGLTRTPAGRSAGNRPQS